MIQHMQINKCDNHINKMKGKNHMIMSTNAEKSLEIIQHPFTIKTPNKLGVEGMYLNIIKSMYERPTANIILNGERLKAFSLRLG